LNRDVGHHRIGRRTVLVLHAGLGPDDVADRDVQKWSDDEFEAVLALNLGSVWHLSRAVSEPMREQGKGTIVNISSGASLLAMPLAAPYGAAKAGVNNLTGSMAAAWTRKGIRVNAIACGAIRAATLMDEAERLGRVSQ